MVIEPNKANYINSHKVKPNNKFKLMIKCTYIIIIKQNS
jgi:hypothetical protein